MCFKVWTFLMHKDILGETVNFIFVWVILMVCHMAYRRTVKKTDELIFPMPGYPFTDILTIAFFLFVLVMLLLDSNMVVSIVLAVIWFACLLAIYFLRFRRKKRRAM